MKENEQPQETIRELPAFSILSESIELQSRLFEKYPLFFRAARFPRTYPSNFGYWGLQCGPGWFPVVEGAAMTIEAELNKLLLRMSENSTLGAIECSLKRARIGHRCDEALIVDEDIHFLIPYCSDVYQDNGALRITLVNGYLCDGATWQGIRAAVDRATMQASHLCERCGKPGRYRVGYWCRVYCDECVIT